MIRKCLVTLCMAITSLPCFSQPVTQMTLSQSTFEQLPSWKQDDHRQALLAFKQSCIEILKRDPQIVLNPNLQQIKNKQWQAACKAALNMQKMNRATARNFFESWFTPFHVANDNHYEGIFTGYYLPLLHARLKPNKQFSIPIHALPNDLIKVDLGLFRPEFTGKTITGQLKNNLLTPYPDRQTIINGGINNKAAPVIAWSNNLIDVYFAQIQGSAVVELPNKHRFVIGYAGDNGHKYTAIGKVLITNNQLTKQTVSMQSIRDWLSKHPKQVDALLNQNASYVFFKILKDRNPLGTEKIPLTPERSLAIDNLYIPFGAPLWLSTTIPNKLSSQSPTPFRHLLIAQDTGGAIKGAIRGDIYWGTGDKAEFVAGHMNSSGEYWILLPKGKPI